LIWVLFWSTIDSSIKEFEMLTTKQVRAIMRKHNPYRTLWTNKTTGDNSNIRRVKCYYYNNRDRALYDELVQKTGLENVRVTSEGGLTVRCVLA